MKTKLIHDKGRVRLILDDPKKSRTECDILADLRNYADSSCWVLEDIRLTKHHVIGHYPDDDENRAPTRFATKKEAEDELAECFSGMRESKMVFDEGDYRISKGDDCGLTVVEADDDQDGPSMR